MQCWRDCLIFFPSHIETGALLFWISSLDFLDKRLKVLRAAKHLHEEVFRPDAETDAEYIVDQVINGFAAMMLENLQKKVVRNIDGINGGLPRASVFQIGLDAFSKFSKGHISSDILPHPWQTPLWVISTTRSSAPPHPP